MKQLTQQQQKISETFSLGQRAMQLGLFEQAEKHFLAVLKIRPDIVEVQNALGFAYAASKQYTKACVQFKATLKTKPNHAHTHHNLANCLYELSNYDEAIIHYQVALKLAPNLVDSHIHCGIAYRMLKNYEKAIACLHIALNLDKTNAKAFHILGVIHAEMEDFNRALHCLECATGLAPDNPVYRVCFANVLEKASLEYEAGLQYHLACESNPNYFDGFNLYGAHLLKNRRHDEALECFEHAKLLAPQDLEIFDQLGHTYLGMGDTDAALDKFNAALLIEPERWSSLHGVGKVYQETGKSDAAMDIANKMMMIDGDLPTGYLLQSSIKKSHPDDKLAEHLLKFSNQADLKAETKIIANFALGKVFDDHKNYADAFKYYAIGNALKNKTLNYSKEEDKAKFTKLVEFFRADFFKEHEYLGIESDSPVVIVGMPRSGTTLTEQIISSHPKVIGAGEVDFWGRAASAVPLRLTTNTPYPDCLNEMKPEQAKDIANMYESTLQKIAGPKTKPTHITDKMPHNFLNVGLVALLFPNVKIIHTKRDPVDTCLSIYFQNFNTAHPYAFDLSNLGFHYKQYERIMRHWHEVLPGRIMDINYEDTISDPEFWSRKLIDHIGLEWDDACLAPHKLERSVKTASHWQVRQPIYKTSIQRWKNYEKFLEPLIEALKD
jgi:tetratricopeptide (TPR) repeat protein